MTEPKNFMEIVGQLLEMLNEEQRDAVLRCAKDSIEVVKTCVESKKPPILRNDIPDMRQR